MRNGIDVSVIVPAFNRAPQLARVLRALACQDEFGCNYEVIVVDDGSTDETAAVLSEAAASSPCPLHIVMGPRGGPAAARNRGLDVAQGGYVLFTDSDCEPNTDWMRTIICELRNGADAVGGRTEVPSVASWVIKTANYVMQTWLGGMGRRWALWGFIPGYRLRTGNMGAATAVVRAVGGFDVGCGYYGEDAVLSERIIEQIGARIACSRATVVHNEDRRIGDIVAEVFAKGWATRRLVRKGLLRARGIYAVPPLLLTVILLLPIARLAPLSWGFLCGLLAAYGFTLVWFGLWYAIHERHLAPVFVVPVVALTMHLAWAAGYLTACVTNLVLVKGNRSPVACSKAIRELESSEGS